MPGKSNGSTGRIQAGPMTKALTLQFMNGLANLSQEEVSFKMPLLGSEALRKPYDAQDETLGGESG